MILLPFVADTSRFTLYVIYNFFKWAQTKSVVIPHMRALEDVIQFHSFYLDFWRSQLNDNFKKDYQPCFRS